MKPGALVCLSALVLTAPLGAAPPKEPLRVALPGLERLVYPNRESTFNCALGLYLRSRLEKAPSIALVSEKRSDTIWDALIGAGEGLDAPDLPGAFCEFQPIDACVRYTMENDTIRVFVDASDKRLDEAFPYSSDMPLADAVRRAARIIGEALHLSEQDMAALMEKRFAEPAAFAAYYESQTRPVAGKSTGMKQPQYGDIRLKALEEEWLKDKWNPYFAEQIFKNAYEISASQREWRFRVDWLWMAQESLPGILGSPFETNAYPMIALRPDDFENQLFDLCKPFSEILSDGFSMVGSVESDDTAAADGGNSGGDLSDASMDAMISEARAAERTIPPASRLGALRALGFLGKPKALDVLKEMAAHADQCVREAAAFGLSVFPQGAGLPRLREMANDKADSPAWTAALGLWRAGERTPRLSALARKAAAGESPHKSDAIETLCEIGDSADLPLIRDLWNRRSPSLRAQLLRARIRLKDITGPEWVALLQDTDEAVVLEALGNFRELSQRPDLIAEAKRLANDAYGPVARAARNAILPLRPTDPMERAIFDLKYEHPYLRRKALALLAQDKSPLAEAIIEEACANRDAHTRAEALSVLTDLAPDRARAPVLQALSDHSRWVRFHAAVLAAKLADSAATTVLEERLRVATEPAERSYLEDALARARGLPPPAEPPRARSIAGAKNLAWNTSPAMHADTSPFEAYYSMKVKSDPFMRKAHEAGKIIFGRATPIFAPGRIELDVFAADEFWMALEQEITADDISILDGLVFGEETMKMPTDILWEDGWRVFCLEANIPPERVDGKMENLNAFEHRAWGDWAIARHIEGFNRLHDFAKLKYGKLRPGLQICTFLPAEGLPHPGSPDAVPTWKFDLGGVYDYKGDNRMAGYNLIRRYKTIWPDRPVLWLSLGIGGYEMNPVRHDQKVPQVPMLERYDRAFADSLTAWIAGADTGWFSTWFFVRPDFNRDEDKFRGVQVWVEDLGPDPAPLERAIQYSFAGVEDIEAEKLASSPPDAPDIEANDLTLADVEEIPDLEGEEKMAAQVESIIRAAQDRKQQFREGFRFYQRYVYDCGRVFGSLPRMNPRPRALAVRDGVNVWTRPTSPYPLVPGQALLNEYDFLCDVNMLCRVDIDRYRYIVAHRSETLRDETIERVTRWLREVKGLLVVHLDMPANNDAEAGTASDHDGRLANDWPWEADIRPVFDQYPKDKCNGVALTGTNGELDVTHIEPATTWDISGKNAEAVYSCDKHCVVALWRNPERFQGAVLFDGVQHGSAEYLLALRNEINRIHKAYGVGLELNGPACLELAQTDRIQAAASNRYYGKAKGKVRLAGLDVMTGEVNPEVGGELGQKSSLVARDYIGKHLAATMSITALSDEPFISARKDGDDLILHSAGVIRASSLAGSVRVTPEDGKTLPEVDDPVSWLLFSEKEGVARFPRLGHLMTYVRSSSPVRMRASEFHKSEDGSRSEAAPSPSSAQ